MRLTWPSTECDRIISYNIFLNSILKTISEQIRAYKNVYGNCDGKRGPWVYWLMKQHTNMTIYSYRKREENKEEKESDEAQQGVHKWW